MCPPVGQPGRVDTRTQRDRAHIVKLKDNVMQSVVGHSVRIFSKGARHETFREYVVSIQLIPEVSQSKMLSQFQAQCVQGVEERMAFQRWRREGGSEFVCRRFEILFVLFVVKKSYTNSPSRVCVGWISDPTREIEK